MKKKKLISTKNYTQIVSEMIKKLEDERRREREILKDELEATTKGKKIKLEGNLTSNKYLFD